MALNLVGQDIETDAGDSGTYTWDDIVALGSTNLSTSIATNGKPFYRWVGRIWLRGTATLTATGKTIELFRANRSTSPGQIYVDDSAQFIIQNSTIIGTYYDFYFAADGTRYLLRSNTSTSQINAYESVFFLGTTDTNTGEGNGHCEFQLNTIRNCAISSQQTTPNGDGYYLGKSAGSITNLLLNGISLDVLYTAPISIAGLRSYGGKFGASNWVYDGVEIRDFAVSGSPTYDFYAPTTVYTTFIDSEIDLSRFLIMKFGSTLATDEYKKAASHSLRIRDSVGNVNNALVTYTGRTTVSDTSDSSGLVDEFVLIYEETDLQAQPNPGGDWSTYPLPLDLVDYSSYTREIRSYLHQPISESLTVGQKVGSATLPFDLQLVVDSGVTQTNTTTVSGYTGVSHTSTATTISGTRTLAETYDSRKLYWRTNGGLYPSLVGVVADWGAIDLVISGTLSGVTKFRDGIKTSSGDITIASPGALTTNLETVSGTVTLQAAGDYSSIVGTIGASATVVVANGSTNLEGWVGNGSTINVSSGSATVTVDDTGDWTAGSGVTLQQPQATLTAANFADGTRVQVAHRQVFTVSASDINTTTNAIALGNDSNGDAPAFDTSPRTLVRFSKPSGSTLPVSSPHIRGNGLYFASLSGSNLTLSITDGGSAIDFSTQGSGTFELIAETELDNSVVSGGSGYSHTLSLSNGALARVKAIHWSESGGDASCSIFYDQIFAWSSVAGITIIDTIDNTVEASQDAIHERLVAIPSITLAAEIEDATGAISDTYSLTSDGSTVTGLSLALEGRGKVQVNSDDTDGILLWQTLYLWGKYICSTESGIRLASSTSFVAKDIFTYSFLYLEFDNTSTTQLLVVGGIGMSADGSNPISTTSNSIILNAVSQGNGAIVPVGSGLSTEQATQLAAIHTKTETLENGLTTAQETKVDQIKTKVDSLTNGLTSEQLTTLNEIQTQVDSLENGLTSTQLTLVTAIKTQVDSLYNGLTTEQATTLGAIQTAVAALYNGLTPTQATSLSTIQTAVASLYNGLTPSQGTQLSEIETKVNTLENGLTSSQATQVTAIKTKVDTLENGLTTAQADQVDDIETAIAAIQILETERNKAIGLISGVSASQQDPTEDEPGFLTTSDDAIDITLTLTDGVITATRN